MSDTLRSILCGEQFWCWDEEGGNTITFHKNGTGELQCRANFNVWIGAEFDWKGDESLDQIIDMEDDSQKRLGLRLIGLLNLEITLTTRRTPLFRSHPLAYSRINEGQLADEAFRPKVYTVRLEKGNFTSACPPSWKPRFALRLVFDVSPYPPRAEWKDPTMGPDEGSFWTRKEFVGRLDPELVDEKRFP